MKYLMWLLKAAIFFTLFAFALNNQQDATVHFFFGTQWRSAAGADRAGRLRWAWPWACWAWCRAGGANAQRRRARPQQAPNGAQAAPPPDARRRPPMEFDLSWLLLGLPLAFVLGWLASRLDLRQLRIENRQAPKAYFKGLNFLLNEQQDQAIDAFIEAVQNDPDTSELHFALGNLFRRRGEYERAVRVHEHLLSRGDLSRADRERAQHALALDFLRAGLLDRAEEALRKLEGTAFETQARLALLAIYERSRDWAQAADIARRLETGSEGTFTTRIAHYLCEQAAQASDEGPNRCCARP
jgi:tetratricopeptide (TPR) repeat protein